MKRGLFALLILAAFAVPSFASTTAVSCNNTVANPDIQNALDAEAGSETGAVAIPAGTCSIAVKILVTHGVTITCAAAHASVMTDNTPRGDSAILFNPSANFKVDGCEFVPNHSDAISSCDSGGVSPCTQQFIEIQGTAPRWEFVNMQFGTDGWPLVTERIFRNDSGCNTGVLHNSTAYVRNELFISGGAACGGKTFGNYNWSIVSNWGSLDQVIIENNNLYNHTASGSRVSNASVMDAVNGPRFTIRFNTIEDMYINPHGTESSTAERGVRLCEVYGNVATFTDLPNGAASGFVFIRSGTCIAHHNTITGYVSVIYGINYRANNAYRPWQGLNDGRAAVGASPYDNLSATIFATGQHTGGNNASLVLTTTGTTFGTTTYAPLRTNLAGAAGIYTGGNNYSICNTTQNWCTAIISTTDTTITGMQGIGSDDVCFTDYNGCTSGHMIWNTNDTYTIRLATAVLDGIGYGKGQLLTGGVSGDIHPTPVEWAANIREPMYVFDNAGSSHDGYTPGTNYDPFVQDGRDIITDRPSSPAKVFADVADVAHLPANCVIYSGVWVTGGTNWNDGSNANYTGDGDFYQCTATDTWTKLYTPANYPWNGAASCTPHHLTFIAQPTSVNLSANLGTVTVGVYDSGNTLCSSATTSISVAKNGSATWGTLSGTSPVSASGGIATFSDLSVTTTAGSGSIDVSASGGLTGATSTSFTISNVSGLGGALGRLRLRTR